MDVWVWAELGGALCHLDGAVVVLELPVSLCYTAEGPSRFLSHLVHPSSTSSSSSSTSSKSALHLI
eukprot:2236871-Pyramimonas_sp.AAC.1